MAARRKARLLAAAFATVPALLVVVALAPRVWAPDLVPYGPAQATLIADAVRRAGTPWLRLYADPSFPLAGVVAPLLRDLPWPVSDWIVVRALLDALGAGFLYLAVGHMLGRGAGSLAALLYIVSPVGWANARDAAGTLAGVLVAAGLLAAIRVTVRPTPLNGIVLGLVLAALVRAIPPGWGFVLGGAVALALGRASWITGSLTALALLLGAGPAIWTRTGGLLPNVATFASHWQAIFGSLAWMPPESVLPGGVTLSGLLIPAACVMLVLALSGAIHALVSGWTCASRVCLLPVWVILGALSLVMLPPTTGESVAIVAMLPLLASLAVVPLATSRRVAVRAPTGLAIVALIGVGAVTIELNVIGVEQAAQAHTTLATLRGWQALADTVQSTVSRTGATDLVVLGDDGQTSPIVDSLLHGAPVVRTLPPGGSVVPLARETIFLDLPGTTRPVELTRPSSRVAVFTAFGADTGAHLLSLRPRPAIDWLARAEPVTGARFADGSAVVGVVADRSTPGRLSLTLFWELPAAADGRSVGQTARLTVRDAGQPGQQDLRLPPVSVRRGGELVVQQTLSPLGAPAEGNPTVTVGLLDASGAPIQTRDDTPEVTILAPRSPNP